MIFNTIIASIQLSASLASLPIINPLILDIEGLLSQRRITVVQIYVN